MLFNNDIDMIIKQAMLNWGHFPNHFVMISALIPQYTAKQIGERWRNILDPRLDHIPLDENEKRFIDQWMSNRETGITSWVKLQRDLENSSSSGRFRSTNKLKNYWYSKQRNLSQHSARSSNKFDLSYILNPIDNFTNSS